MEQGGVLSCAGVSSSAQSFLVALLHEIAPDRPIVVVAESLKAQEQLEQDVATWLRTKNPDAARPLFYPAWETLPHEARLPHSDVISERLETLVALQKSRAARSREYPI